MKTPQAFLSEAMSGMASEIYMENYLYNVLQMQIINWIKYAFYSSTGFFNKPRRTAPTIVPATRATTYIRALPTTGNTKIPP